MGCLFRGKDLSYRLAGQEKSLPGGGGAGGSGAAMVRRRSGGRPEDRIGRQMTGGSGKTGLSVREDCGPDGCDVAGERERDLGEGVHVDGREIICFLAVCLRDITPWGRRLAGEGGGGYGSPLPCLLCLWLNGIRRPPPPPGRYRGHRPPPQGGGQSVAIARIPCQGEGKDFVRVFTLTAESDLSLAVIYGESPRGRGLTGKGVEHPLRRLCLWLNGIRGITPRPPPSGLLLPLKGGGQYG